MIAHETVVVNSPYYDKNARLTVCYYHVTNELKSESTLRSLPECQGTPCSKQPPYLKFK